MQTTNAGDGTAPGQGRSLFDEETFGGNGRTCVTCHSVESGTFDTDEVRKRLDRHDGDPLFRHDGLDDGFSGTTRIEEHATIRVEIDLPPWVTLKDEPGATSVILNRGVPTTINAAALDPFFQYDGRFATLQEQAAGAILGHAQVETVVDPDLLDALADFQSTNKRFFSSRAIRKFAADSSKPPRLPDGESASEKRGRAMFDDVPIDPDSKAGICAICHSGPMLNQFNEHNPFGAPPGASISNILVSERNLIGNPVYTFVVQNLDGTTVEVESPDPGILLHPDRTLLGAPPPGVPGFPYEAFANFFKTPQLWGVSKTAPYFHDNSAATLKDVAEHYNFTFQNSIALGFPLTAQDQADMVAFLKLLDGDDSDSDSD